jgi:hypothetical protein
MYDALSVSEARCMRTPSGIYLKPSTKGVKDLSPYADRACSAVEGLNLRDSLSVMVGAILAAVLSAKPSNEAGPQIIDTAAHALSMQYADCKARFGAMTNEQLDAAARA